MKGGDIVTTITICVCMIIMGVTFTFFPQSQINAQNKKRAKKGQPKMTDEEVTASTKKNRIIGICCLILAAVVVGFDIYIAL